MHDIDSHIERRERRVAEIEREARDFKWRMESELARQKDNFFLLLMALIPAATVVIVLLKRH